MIPKSWSQTHRVYPMSTGINIIIMLFLSFQSSVVSSFHNVIHIPCKMVRVVHEINANHRRRSISRHFSTSLHCTFCNDNDSVYQLSSIYQNKINNQESKLFFSSSSSSSSSPKDETNTNDKKSNNKITKRDIIFMNLALDAAQKGVGNTYPNPAVGCVLVEETQNENNHDNDNHDTRHEVIGIGFHPKAGYPHAEIFALFQACGYVESGEDAAQTVVQQTKIQIPNKIQSTSSSSTPITITTNVTIEKVNELLNIYSSNGSKSKDEGAKQLFHNAFENKYVTAYVTLEPCCHYGLTPPCALSLVYAGVKRVVVGFRDPNPRVDGGGVLLLQNEGIDVDFMTVCKSNNSDNENIDGDHNYIDTLNAEIQKSANECANIVKAFAKRITPRTEDNGGSDVINFETNMNGAKRSFLRSLAGKWKKDGSMPEFEWQSYLGSIEIKDGESFDLHDAVQSFSLDHGCLEIIDGILWDREVILLRFNNVVSKKKGAKLLGERIADELKAHVAQVVGHTVLLYRPGLPPVLDLDKLIEDQSS